MTGGLLRRVRIDFISWLLWIIPNFFEKIGDFSHERKKRAKPHCRITFNWHLTDEHFATQNIIITYYKKRLQCHGFFSTICFCSSPKIFDEKWRKMIRIKKNTRSRCTQPTKKNSCCQRKQINKQSKQRQCNFCASSSYQVRPLCAKTKQMIFKIVIVVV